MNSCKRQPAWQRPANLIGPSPPTTRSSSPASSKRSLTSGEVVRAWRLDARRG